MKIVIYGFESYSQKKELQCKIAEFYKAEKDQVGFGIGDYDYVLSRSNLPQEHFAGIEAISLKDFAKMYNDSIPLTDWISGKPRHVGEYNASIQKSKNSNRYWNGENWSVYFHKDSNQVAKNNRSGLKNYEMQNVEYRGLSKEPIILD